MAETRSTATSPMSQVGIVPVRVSDQDEAIEFFVNKLGFELRSDVPYGNQRWVEVAPPGGQTPLVLSTDEGPGMAATFNTPDLEAAVEELCSRGVEFEGDIMEMESPAPPMIFFRDAYGNRYLLVERSA
jgi:catechol 2,3-dioxygenase-like lactoylglutathione lyase family enzyme